MSVAAFKRWYYRFLENLQLALQSIRGSKVRAILTMLIVAVGIMSLVGMITVMNAVVESMQSSMGSQQGATLTVRSWSPNMRVMGKRTRGQHFQHISYREAQGFVRDFKPHGEAAIRMYGNGVQGTRGSKSTRPRLYTSGVSENFFNVENMAIAEGRGFSERECLEGLRVVVVGEGIVDRLFDKGEQYLGQRITLSGASFTIVGVLGKRLSTFGSSNRDAIYLPIQTLRTCFSAPDMDCELLLKPRVGLSDVVGQEVATLIMRGIRHLRPADEENFKVSLRNEMLEMILKSMTSIGVGILLIGLITLLGSSIGLMNIMLASVSERIREIGTRKALGAYSSTIRQQFLIESVTITLLGGILGIFLGLLLGFIIAHLMHIQFAMPWLWILGAVALCILVGVGAGYLPAKRAAKLDPIIALRHE